MESAGVLRQLKRLRTNASLSHTAFDFYAALPAAEHSRDELLDATRRRAALLRGEEVETPLVLNSELDRASFYHLAMHVAWLRPPEERWAAARGAPRARARVGRARARVARSRGPAAAPPHRA